jgi:hypothetical protein
MGNFEDCLDGFEEKCEDICDVLETCEVCGGLMYDQFGRSMRRYHIECRRILALEQNGCDG